jgi:hypothetical protein
MDDTDRRLIALLRENARVPVATYAPSFGPGALRRSAMISRRLATAVGFESKPLPDTASCTLTISATESCSSRKRCIISEEARVAWPRDGAGTRSHWLLNNNPPTTLASIPVVNNRTTIGMFHDISVP